MDYQIRIKLLKNLKKIIIKYQNEIAVALQKDLNKAEHETLFSEIYPVVREINYLIKHTWKYKDVKLAKLPIFSKKGYVYSPRGNVLIMNSWNYPINLLFIPLAGSIAAGNTNVVKLHPFVLESKKVIEKILNELDPQEQYIKVDDSYTFADMFESHKIDFLFFTGSSKTASNLKKLIDKHDIEYCFELGGKSPFIVTQYANIDLAVEQFFYGKMLNGGQTCVAPDYIFIDAKVAQTFSLKLNKKIDDFFKSEQDWNNVAHLVNEHTLIRVMSYLEDGKADFNLLKIKPQIVQTNDLTDQIYHEEIFAPVAPMYIYKEISEFEHVYNQNPNPLAFYLFSNNKNDWNFFKQFKAGNYMINSTISILDDNSLSFGGYKQSGFGRYRGKASYEVFSVKSSYVKTYFDPYKTFKIHPYKATKTKILKLIMKF
ncbi:aldehyde dehydrogenase family protein, partial [Mycoplasmopsis pullorum]|uniref:aldehyde dehydrogenase family protein n=1 Tax=Mycoplasmopsis pullorum TaxID=48003 RepID=UPI00111BC164